jgi:hypothetical protein
MANDLDLLRLDFRTLFLIDGAGRIERENDPDHSPGPKLWLAGCRSGNVAGLRHDVASDVVAEVMALVDSEPPFCEPGMSPRHAGRYASLLSPGAEAPGWSLEVIHELPRGLDDRAGVPLIDSEGGGGGRFLESVRARGMPAGLAAMGFREVADLWPPWCMAMHGGEVASVAFAARISGVGAELGLATVPAFRGRGYGSAAAAGWSRLPSLQSLALFYSAEQSNASSLRVIARLGLPPLGASLRLA